MADSERCELHEVAIFDGAQDSEDLRRLARSPIGDECQICAVCRDAREYVERRLAEEAGLMLPPGQGAEAAWRKLQSSIAKTKATVRHQG